LVDQIDFYKLFFPDSIDTLSCYALEKGLSHHIFSNQLFINLCTPNLPPKEDPIVEDPTNIKHQTNQTQTESQFSTGARTSRKTIFMIGRKN
jgi:hypothetical protein